MLSLNRPADELVALDVGGQIVQCERALLMRCPRIHSALTAHQQRCSDSASLPPMPIDCDPPAFLAVLAWLRTGVLPADPPTGRCLVPHVRTLAISLGLRMLSDALPPDRAPSIEAATPTPAAATVWTPKPVASSFRLPSAGLSHSESVTASAEMSPSFSLVPDVYRSKQSARPKRGPSPPPEWNNWPTGSTSQRPSVFAPATNTHFIATPLPVSAPSGGWRPPSAKPTAPIGSIDAATGAWCPPQPPSTGKTPAVVFKPPSSVDLVAATPFVFDPATRKVDEYEVPVELLCSDKVEDTSVAVRLSAAPS